MSEFVGADVEQVEALARRYEIASQKLTQLMNVSSLGIMVTEWTGADIERLRSDWNRQAKPSIARSVAALSQIASTLKTQAAEQREASAAAVGPAGAGGKGDAAGTGEAEKSAPQNLHGLADDLKELQNKDEIFRIKEVIGPDGVTRFVVYFPGTKGEWWDLANYGQLGGWGENSEISTGGNSDIAIAVEERLRLALGENPQAEVMLVGFSQGGGMLAKQIADGGQFNVQEVVTFASPSIPDYFEYGGANVTELAHEADLVVNGALPLKFIQGAGMGIADVVSGVMGYETASHGSGEYVDFKGGNRFERGVHNIGKGDYQWLADQYEASTDARHVAARERQDLFLGGTEVADRWASEVGASA